MATREITCRTCQQNFTATKPDGQRGRFPVRCDSCRNTPASEPTQSAG